MIRISSIIILLLLSFCIISCGGGNNKANTSFSVDALLAEERSLTTNEIQIATRICYAFQVKSQNFRSSEFYGSKFTFSGTKNDCQNIKYSYEIRSTLKFDDKNTLSYIPDKNINEKLTFNNKVQTDSVGYLTQICQKILTNQKVVNTATEQNIKIQIAFFVEDLDGFTLQYFNKQNENLYKFDSGEKFKITTEVDSFKNKIKGMDQFYSSFKICPNLYDKGQSSYFEQNFIYH